VREYADRMGFVELIDEVLVSSMRVSAGKIVLGLVMNTLCGRSPLYRVEEFFRTRDVELLLGSDMTLWMLNDDAIGRVLDRIYEYGTWKLFSSVSVRACKRFCVDCAVVHEDTTSVSVHGDYKPRKGDPFLINHGFSKDKRPDLKQFVLSLLCVEGNLPFHGGILDGNTSDKKLHGNILRELPGIMARHGQKEFVYVADSALATKENFSLMEHAPFVTRLPENFSACRSLISKEVASGSWQDAGRLSHRVIRGTDIRASYRLHEEALELYDITYRAIVVHSDAHDKRRQKRIDKAVKKDAEAVKNRARELTQKEFFCLPDAKQAIKAFKNDALHQVSFTCLKRPVYDRGRPRKDGTRRVKGVRYRVSAQITQNIEAVTRLQEEAGCFVLLTNVPQKSGLDILKLYKEQEGIERNFAFLKDPLVANAVFLKKPHRIEAMGLVLVLALLVWRLMERTMRMNLKEEHSRLQGWNGRETDRPTALMIASKFSPVFVGLQRGRRSLFTPLDKVQLAYLKALKVPSTVFTEISPPPGGVRTRSP
jgi:transposase